jgi:hypothetical protein
MSLPEMTAACRLKQGAVFTASPRPVFGYKICTFAGMLLPTNT